MRSNVKANGDVIRQWQLEAVLGAERALHALIFSVCQRIAAGARVQRGKLDIEVEAFRLGKDLDLAELEAELAGWSGCFPGGIEINTSAEVAKSERVLTRLVKSGNRGHVRRQQKRGRL